MLSGKLFPRWVVRQRLFRFFGLAGEGPSARHGCRSLIDLLVRQLYSGDAKGELDAEWKVLRCGWYAGGQNFRDGLEALVDKVVRANVVHHTSNRAVARLEERMAEQWLGNILTALRPNP